MNRDSWIPTQDSRPKTQHLKTMNTFRRRRWLFPLFPLAAIALFSLVVMLLWNAIIPGITGWALLTYWKAMGLLVLCKILFGGFPGRHRGSNGPTWMRDGHKRSHWWRGLSGEERERWKERRHDWREKWERMDEAERTKFRDRWRNRCQAQWRQDQEGPEQ